MQINTEMSCATRYVEKLLQRSISWTPAGLKKSSLEKVTSYAFRLFLSVSKSRQYDHLHLLIFKIHTQGWVQREFLCEQLACVHSAVSKRQWMSSLKRCQLSVRCCRCRETSFTLTECHFFSPPVASSSHTVVYIFHAIIVRCEIISYHGISLKEKKN